jgi:hypothetical protein
LHGRALRDTRTYITNQLNKRRDRPHVKLPLMRQRGNGAIDRHSFNHSVDFLKGRI